MLSEKDNTKKHTATEGLEPSDVDTADDDHIDLVALCNEVDSEQSLLAFLEHMREEFEYARSLQRNEPQRGIGPNDFGWESTTIDGFLDAMVAYGIDAKSRTDNPWQRMAHLMLAGKMYE